MSPDWLVLQPLVPWPVVAGCAVVALLAVSASALRQRRRTSWLLRAAVVLLLALACLGPRVGVEQVTYRERPDVQVVVALDRTASMAVRDVAGGSRFEQATGDLVEVVRAAEAPVAVVVWGSGARVAVPFTTDVAFLTRTFPLLETELPATGSGSRVDEPLPTLTRLVAQAEADRPDRLTYLVLLSDGENTAPGNQRSYAALAGAVDGGVVVGYGSADGGPVPLDPDDPGGFVPAPDGAGRAVSRRVEENLQRVAAELDVEYLSREEVTADDLVAALRPPARVAGEGPAPRDVTWVVALLLLVLLGADLRAGVRSVREAGQLRRLGRSS